MTTEAQKKALKKYKTKVKRLTIDFPPSDAELWEHIQKQTKKQTYIKDLIRADKEVIDTPCQWIGDYDCGAFVLVCSKCNEHYWVEHENARRPNYCPGCGAKMK